MHLGTHKKRHGGEPHHGHESGCCGGHEHRSATEQEHGGHAHEHGHEHEHEHAHAHAGHGGCHADTPTRND